MTSTLVIAPGERVLTGVLLILRTYGVTRRDYSDSGTVIEV